jgi:hypothetical protein
VQHVADPQRAPGVAAELAEREGGFAAEIVRHVEAAAHREIGAAAGVLDRAEFQDRTGLHGMRAQLASGCPSSSAPMSAPASAITRRS